MRAAAVLGMLIAILGLVGGPLGFVASTNVIQQVVCALGTITGVLGLLIAVVGNGLADLRKLAATIDKNLAELGNRIAPDPTLKITEWRPNVTGAEG
jgi:hypothetical protein